jgi:hypothetical protein
MKDANRYERLIEEIFFTHYRRGVTEFDFRRDEIEHQATKLKIVLPKNLGDLIYGFRYRMALPTKIREKAPAGKEWLILPAGRGKYRFALADFTQIVPDMQLTEIKIPDATPGLISMYSLTDEQSLLARLRYNRLIDVFSHVTCYSLQSHLRATVPDIGQVETDEIYVGLDRRGAHYVFPVQAKGGKDKLSAVQVRQDIELCARKFPNLVCRPIGAQFVSQDLIVLFELEECEGVIRKAAEKHYRLTPPDDLTSADLERYRHSMEG